MSEWFEHWFGEEYLDLYPHRDDRDAERAVALLAANGYVRPGQRVLDLACGAGRHAAALERSGGPSRPWCGATCGDCRCGARRSTWS